mgnify:FL=1
MNKKDEFKKELYKCYKEKIKDCVLYYYVWSVSPKWCETTCVVLTKNTFQIDSHFTLRTDRSFTNKTEIPMSEFKAMLAKAIRGATNILNGI